MAKPKKKSPITALIHDVNAAIMEQKEGRKSSDIPTNGLANATLASMLRPRATFLHTIRAAWRGRIHEGFLSYGLYSPWALSELPKVATLEHQRTWIEYQLKHRYKNDSLIVAAWGDGPKPREISLGTTATASEETTAALAQVASLG
jgi:hypothetical protein